jgi:hypothetical protein
MKRAATGQDAEQLMVEKLRPEEARKPRGRSGIRMQSGIEASTARNQTRGTREGNAKAHAMPCSISGREEVIKGEEKE